MYSNGAHLRVHIITAINNEKPESSKLENMELNYLLVRVIL